jgi:thioredoxin-related protein
MFILLQKFVVYTMRIFIFLSCFVILSCKNEPKEILWVDMKSADVIDNTKEPKKYFVDLYTDWCGWCKVMDKETFSKPAVTKFMNENFHNVKFDAESKETINFNGKQYVWLAGGRNGVNMLAVELLNSQLSYPSYAILDENKNPITVIAGYMDEAQFLSSIDAYKKVTKK